LREVDRKYASHMSNPSLDNDCLDVVRVFPSSILAVDRYFRCEDKLFDEQRLRLANDMTLTVGLLCCKSFWYFCLIIPRWRDFVIHIPACQIMCFVVVWCGLCSPASARCGRGRLQDPLPSEAILGHTLVHYRFVGSLVGFLPDL
jgi:hypothetical protein